MFEVSPELQIDGYKVGHHAQYPKGLELLYSNMTPRSLKYFKGRPGHDGKVVVLGLQAFIQDYLVKDWGENFFGRFIGDVLEDYQAEMDEYLGKGAVTTDHLQDLHALGYLPLLIKAMPEGSRIPAKVPFFTIRNTEPGFGWLVNYLETILSQRLWATPTIATIAHEYRRIMEKYADLTGTPKEAVLFQGHDFSMRGVTDTKAAIGHLASFLGTDTIPAIQFIKHFYGARGPIGLSVPASEHSVASCNIADIESRLILEANIAGDSKYEAEKIFFQRYISEIYPSGICSYVSDTYDFFRVITDIAKESKDLILAREPNALGLAKVVFRPDSGHPVDIICGERIRVFKTMQDAEDTLQDEAWDEAAESCEGSYCMGDDTYTRLAQVGDEFYEFKFDMEYNRHDKRYYYVDGANARTPTRVILTPEQKGAVRCLWETFGGTLTHTGHKMLNERVGLIYGDSITLEICRGDHDSTC